MFFNSNIKEFVQSTSSPEKFQINYPFISNPRHGGCGATVERTRNKWAGQGHILVLARRSKSSNPFKLPPPSLGIDLIAASIYNEYVSGILRSNFNEITTHLVWTVTVTWPENPGVQSFSLKETDLTSPLKYVSRILVQMRFPQHSVAI